MIAGAITFPCGDINLEGEIIIPSGEPPFPGIVVCHPHPLYGGDMLNNVVSAICRAAVEQAIITLRFNFRGVGNSGGRHGGGNDERQDVEAALNYLVNRPETDVSRIGLVGYSFGATVALAVAAEDERVNRLALVSPPLSEPNQELLKNYRQPKITLVGDADHFVPLEPIRQLANDTPQPKEYQVITGTDHFWLGHEMEAAGRIAWFFSQGFNLS